MLANLAAVAANYRRAGIPNFVLAYFVRTAHEVHAIEQALGASVTVVRLIADLPVIQQRLAGDVTTGRGDDMRAGQPRSQRTKESASSMWRSATTGPSR
jgi:hypothetical protein